MRLAVPRSVDPSADAVGKCRLPRLKFTLYASGAVWILIHRLHAWMIEAELLLVFGAVDPFPDDKTSNIAGSIGVAEADRLRWARRPCPSRA